MTQTQIGPDAYRYLLVGDGQPVCRPFHLRWLLPTLCKRNAKRWWIAWGISWPILIGSFIGWQLAAGGHWQAAIAGAVMLAALPGILGPSVVIPVGVDLPATALSLAGVMLLEVGGWYGTVGGIYLIAVAAMIRETAPIWAALWIWSPLPLVALAAPAIRQLLVKPGADPLPKFQHITDHPVRAALAAHRVQWRDGWVMVAPWGACLAALYAVDWRLGVVLVLAYGQLLIATDTVRLYQHAAGPVMAASAAAVIPTAWLPLVAVMHVVWWWRPHRI